MDVRTYWWQKHANFGDALGPYLLNHFAGIEAVWAAPDRAELVTIGSLLHWLPEGWGGIVAGAGLLRELHYYDLSHATVLGLRGLLTAARCDGVRGDFVVGDPALLAEELIVTERDQHEVGIVPHWTDTILLDRFADLDPYVIDPSDDALTVVRQIAGCKRIISSSLHGVIVADAFGIPRRAEVAPLVMTSPAEGGVFKFHDYASAIGLPLMFGEWQEPPRGQIEAVQSELFDMMLTLRSEVSRAQAAA